MKQCLLFVSLFLSGLAFSQNYSPIPVYGFNEDVIAEDTSASETTTISLDGSDYVLYNDYYGTIYSTGTGLPNGGSITSSLGNYQLVQYNINNAIVLMTGQTDSLELWTPQAYSSLSLLGFSTEGTGTILCVVKFTDGTATVFSNNNLPDWFTGGTTVISGFDRAGRLTGTPDYSTFQPNMYRVNLNLSCGDQAKLVSKVLIINTTSSPTVRTAVFALSGTPPQSASIASFQNVSCYGEGDGFINLASYGLSPITYSWNTTPVSTTQNINSLDPGTYTCTVTDATGCSSTVTQTITGPPNITHSQTAAICNGETFMVGPHAHTTSGTYNDVFTAANGCDSTVTTVLTVTTPNIGITSNADNLSSNAVGAQYQWLDCSTNYGPVSGETSQIFVPDVDGAYAVQVTVNGCVDTSSCVVFLNAGLDNNVLSTINCYPNPVTNQLQIDSKENIVSVTLIDLSGKELKVELVQNAINMSELSKGVYTLKIQTGSGRQEIKQIIKN